MGVIEVTNRFKTISCQSHGIHIKCLKHFGINFYFAAPFFESCINEQDLDEMNIEIIRNTLYKSYLEAFYEFCKNIGGETQDVMCEILAVSRDS